jgi:IS5 family transposase
MREKRTDQVSIFQQYADHEIGSELQAMSAWLDSHPEILEWVAEDLRPEPVQASGRKGLSMDAALRCALLKQYRQLTYEDLVFCLKDSMSCQGFARLTDGWTPEKSALQGVIGRISATTWERINRCLVLNAEKRKIEKGLQVRVDSTVTDTPIHAPTGSTLLGDGVRVMVRLMEEANVLCEGNLLFFHAHRRRAKKRVREIIYTRGKDKKQRLYKDLVDITRKSLSYLMFALNKTPPGVIDPLAWEIWRAEAQHYVPLIVQVIDQTKRRVFQGEKVPVA